MSDNKAAAVDLNAVKTTPYSWFVAILVALTYGVSFVARNVWSTALPVAHESPGITMAAAGGLMTAFYIGYVASNFVTGFLVDKIGPRLTLSLATLLTGIFTLLIPAAPHYAALFALRVLAGASAGPLISGTLTGIIADILKKKRLMCFFGCIVASFCTVLIMKVTNAGPLVAILVARGLFIAFMGTPLNALQAEAAAGPFAGRAMGIYNGIARSGAILFPLLFGFFLDISRMNFDMLFWGIVIGVLLCGVFILFMDEKKVERKPAAA
jgi:MFS family permease